MPVQILRNPSIGGRLGESLGTGLQALAQSKLQEMSARNMQQQSQQRYKQAGFGDQLSQLLSGYPVEQQVQLIKSLGESGALGSLMGNQPGQQPNTSEQIFEQLGQVGGQQGLPEGIPENVQQQHQQEAQKIAPQMLQQALQRGPQQPQGGEMSPAQLFAMPSRKQQLEQENLAVKQERNAIARERKDIAEAKLYKSDNDKVLEAHNEDFKLTQEAVNLAKENLAILRKHPGKFPSNILTRNLPSGIWNDADISLYDANAKRLAFLGLQAAKGNPTDAKQELQLDIKAGIDKPIATQEKLLEKLIKLGDVVFQDDLTIRDALENRHGNIPGSLREKILGRRKNPLLLNTPEDARAAGAKSIRNTETGQIEDWDEKLNKFVPRK